jgi:hypothetical protein
MHSGTLRRRNSWRILGCKLGEFWHSLGKFWEVFVVRNLPKICHFESSRPTRPYTPGTLKVQVCLVGRRRAGARSCSEAQK